MPLSLLVTEAGFPLGSCGTQEPVGDSMTLGSALALALTGYGALTKSFWPL